MAEKQKRGPGRPRKMVQPDSAPQREPVQIFLVARVLIHDVPAEQAIRVTGKEGAVLRRVLYPTHDTIEVPVSRVAEFRRKGWIKGPPLSAHNPTWDPTKYRHRYPNGNGVTDIHWPEDRRKRDISSEPDIDGSMDMTIEVLGADTSVPGGAGMLPQPRRSSTSASVPDAFLIGEGRSTADKIVKRRGRPPRRAGAAPPG